MIEIRSAAPQKEWTPFGKSGIRFFGGRPSRLGRRLLPTQPIAHDIAAPVVESADRGLAPICLSTELGSVWEDSTLSGPPWEESAALKSLRNCQDPLCREQEVGLQPDSESPPKNREQNQSRVVRDVPDKNTSIEGAGKAGPRAGTSAVASCLLCSPVMGIHGEPNHNIQGPGRRARSHAHAREG
jgi:hypothetical protein